MDAATRAAGVAEELLAFYREPALVRTRYLHGDSPMPDGAVVFRLALGRFSSGGMSVAQPEEARVAALAFVRQVCLWERATHYQVLCLAPDAPARQVRENYHLLIALIHPDRHETAWPAACAPRVNEAYAVLSDENRRRAYDELLDKAANRVVAEEVSASRATEPVRHRRHRRRRSSWSHPFARVAAVAGGIAALFLVQAWWVKDDASAYSLLERAMPLDTLRDALPDRPRFLGTAFNPGELLPKLEEPKRIAALGSWLPAPDARAPREAPASARPPASDHVPTPSAPMPAHEAAPIDLRVASNLQAPVRLAQAPPTASAPLPGAAAPSRDQVEGLVALLVSYYDSGDADRLVGLFASDHLGFWSGFRTRNAYADFFGATRDRRLRIDRLAWQTVAGTAQARGEAIVSAEYQDGRSRLERKVPVELDIVLRETQPRLSRLVLYPLGQ